MMEIEGGLVDLVRVEVFFEDVGDDAEEGCEKSVFLTGGVEGSGIAVDDFGLEFTAMGDGLEVVGADGVGAEDSSPADGEALPGGAGADVVEEPVVRESEFLGCVDGGFGQDDLTRGDLGGQ